jgi:hypothetical protein
MSSARLLKPLEIAHHGPAAAAESILKLLKRPAAGGFEQTDKLPGAADEGSTRHEIAFASSSVTDALSAAQANRPVGPSLPRIARTRAGPTHLPLAEILDLVGKLLENRYPRESRHVSPRFRNLEGGRAVFPGVGLFVFSQLGSVSEESSSSNRVTSLYSDGR